MNTERDTLAQIKADRAAKNAQAQHLVARLPRGFLTRAEAMLLPPIYAHEATPNDEKVLLSKWFGGGRGSWFAVEADLDDGRCFGYCRSPLGADCDEWGYFDLFELAAAPLVITIDGIGTRTLPNIRAIERDRYWTPCTFAEAQRKGEV